MNEPTFASPRALPSGYDGAAYGRDFAVFQPFFRQGCAECHLAGAGSPVGEGRELAPMQLLPSKDLLDASGPNPVDVFSYHFYGTISERCGAALGAKWVTSPDAALGEDWLGRSETVEDFLCGVARQICGGQADFS